DAALPALTTETRGQNSWLNFGPYAEHNKHASPADTHYAPQKIGLLPAWTMEGRGDPSASDRIEQHPDHTDITSYLGTEGGVGFLLPNGSAVDIGGDSHEQAADKVDSSLHELYGEGAARIYATPASKHFENAFLGIEIHQDPTRAQVRTLLKAASKGTFGRFAIEGAADVNITGTPLTAAQVREALDEAFPGRKKDFARWFLDWLKEFDESKHPREPAGSPTGGQFTSGEGGGDEGKEQLDPRVIAGGGDEWDGAAGRRV